jgi:hypothetical protein
MINDSNVMQTNQSIMIEPKSREEPKKQVVSEQVQTDDMGNRSLVSERRQKMDQANFHKTIR